MQKFRQIYGPIEFNLLVGNTNLFFFLLTKNKLSKIRILILMLIRNIADLITCLFF